MAKATKTCETKIETKVIEVKTEVPTITLTLNQEEANYLRSLTGQHVYGSGKNRSTSPILTASTPSQAGLGAHRVHKKCHAWATIKTVTRPRESPIWRRA